MLDSHPPQGDAGARVLPASATYQLTDILKGAVHPSIGFPVAAKSGTTTDFKDAWYIGYTTDLAVVSWMGRTVSEPTPHNESMSTNRYGGLWGEVGPAFSWREFMTSYYRGKKPADWTHPAEVSSMSTRNVGPIGSSPSKLSTIPGTPSIAAFASFATPSRRAKSRANSLISTGFGSPLKTHMNLH